MVLVQRVYVLGSGAYASLKGGFKANEMPQLYYQDYLGLDPILTMVRLLPMFITGVTCNVIIALVVSHVPLVVLASASTLLPPFPRPRTLT